MTTTQATATETRDAAKIARLHADGLYAEYARLSQASQAFGVTMHQEAYAAWQEAETTAAALESIAA